LAATTAVTPQSSGRLVIASKPASATNDIIQGRKPVSTWADAVKKWKSGGGDKIAEEYAQALEASR